MLARSLWIRRWKDIVEDHAADYGGAENLSVARVSLVRHQAAALVEMEQLEAKKVGGEGDVRRYRPVQSPAWQRAPEL
jgi:hypothetical protein